MSARPRKMKSALDRRVVNDLPASVRDSWLGRFAHLYHEVVNAAREKDLASTPGRFYLLPTPWRVKLALMRHVLRVHRYKPHTFDSEEDVGDAQVELLPWMIDDFKVFGRNESSLWPGREFLSRFVSRKPEFNCAPGQLYFHLYSPSFQMFYEPLRHTVKSIRWVILHVNEKLTAKYKV